MIKNISHIGIAVKNIDEQMAWYKDVLGLKDGGRDIVEDQGVKVQMFELGDTRIELLEPLNENSPIAKFIENKGQGIHHIAYGTDSCSEALEKAIKSGCRSIDTEPRPGAHGAQIAFLHPKSTYGVLTEFCEDK